MASQQLADNVVNSALAAYAALPKHGKPTVRNNGVPEWTMLASISLTLPPAPEDPTRPPEIKLIALGTGVKVLPAARLPPLGDTVHDCHAEILARRGFVRWLLAEATRVVRGEENLDVLNWEGTTFSLRSGVKLWLYVSALPCGDASTLYTAAHQPVAEADAFRAAAELIVSPEDGAVRGRNGYENFGAIRTKPGRTDSPPTISFSCSDKIASWCAVGLQGALLSDLFTPMYLDHIIIGGIEDPLPSFDLPESGSWHDTIIKEAERALWGRLQIVANHLPPPYCLARPQVYVTGVAFPLSKPAVLAAHPERDDPSPSPVSLSLVPALGNAEVIINGCAQGSGWKLPGSILLRDKQRSRLCKFEILRAYIALADILKPDQTMSDQVSYYQLKHQRHTYQEAKSLLRGCPSQPMYQEWASLMPHAFLVTNGTGDPPFKGWIATGEPFEAFTSLGHVKMPFTKDRV